MALQAKPAFRELVEEDIYLALDNPKDNPIKKEVARLVAAHITVVKRHLKTYGFLPLQLIRVKAQCPIEEVAARMVAELYRDEPPEG
jgi:hypothetical protein